MTDEERVKTALDFATKKHDGQFRIGGLPYITHPIAVSDIVRGKGGDTTAIITALFHDLLEDTDATEQEIENIGGKDVLKAVKLLTKQKGYVMKDYVNGIKGDKTAYLVKGADRLHNLTTAVCADTEFKRRYIYETIDWYLGFMPEIPIAVKNLAKTLDTPLTDLPFSYKSIENWKINK